LVEGDGQQAQRAQEHHEVAPSGRSTLVVEAASLLRGWLRGPLVSGVARGEDIENREQDGQADDDQFGVQLWGVQTPRLLPMAKAATARVR
jgi:hypothetical protein